MELLSKPGGNSGGELGEKTQGRLSSKSRPRASLGRLTRRED